MSQEKITRTVVRSAPKKLTVPKYHDYHLVMPELVKTAKRIAERSEDISLNVNPERAMVLDENNMLSFSFGKDRRGYKLRPLALRQLCEKLQLPSHFFNRLATSEETSDLAYAIFNRLLGKYKGDLLLRICEDEIRGILSPRYYCFDTYKILKVIDFFFKHNPFIKPEEVYIDSYINDMDRFQLRISKKFPGNAYTEKGLRYGLLIDSSDVGLSSIK